jgi:uncharacterized membrane protein YkvA (DUF1232 family)
MRRLFFLWKRGRQDLSLLWFALHHPDRPRWLVPAAVLLAMVAIEPGNFALPLFGAVDELLVLPLLLHAVTSWLPRHVRLQFDERALVRR